MGILACQYYQTSLYQLLRPDYNPTPRQYMRYIFEIPHKQNSWNESNEPLTGTALDRLPAVGPLVRCKLETCTVYGATTDI